MELIERYQFQRNVFATGIQSNKSNCIGLIVPREMDYILTNPFYAEVIRGILNEFGEHEYYLLFCNTQNKDDIVNIFRQRRVDGFILIRLGIYDKDIIEVLKSIDAPFVSTTTISEEDSMLHADINNYEAAGMAVEHLISLGHEKIGMVVASNSLTNSKQRFAAYKDTLAKHGLQFDGRLVAEGDTSMEGGYAAMSQILNRGCALSAVFVAGDIMAIGAMRALKEAGKRVPEDISIIGFDGIPEAEYTDPPLTTIKQPIFEKGKKAAQILINILENHQNNQSVNMDVELVKRGSTANK